MIPLELKDKNCLLYKNLDLLAKRWVIFILLEFSISPKKELRYFQIKESLENITPKILSERLELLVKENFLNKREEKENNKIQTFYSLTKHSILILPILKSLKEWGNDFKYCSSKYKCERCKNLEAKE